MGDVDEKEKAEKLAAAKKRFEQLKKQKGKGAKANPTKKKEEEQPDSKTGDPQNDNGDAPVEPQPEGQAAPREDAPTGEEADQVAEAPSKAKDDEPNKTKHGRQPSLSLQSKMRSASFRRTSLSQGPLSPSANGPKSPELAAASSDGDSVNSIYRKQAARLDELENENKKLASDAQERERQLKRAEEELEEMREGSGEVAELRSKAKRFDAQSEELSTMKQENTSLQRQNSQLHSQTSRRHGSSPSQANAPSPVASLQSQLDSKSAMIESMEMEISSLRSQLDKSSTSTSSHSEQVAALEDKLQRAERAAGSAQRELADVKKSLERASEKALKEGTDKTSNETRIRNLIHESEQAKRSADESIKRAETLEKKLLALTNMNKDADTRRQAGERERERLEQEAMKFHRRLASLENENLQMREERSKNKMRHVAGGTDDDDVLDELEDAEKVRLGRKIRDLETEVFELRRGVWRERRQTLQPGIDGEEAVTSPGGGVGNKFDEIDLDGPSPYRRQSTTGSGTGRGSSFSNVLSSGLSAFTGNGKRNDGLEDFDDEPFDEVAFQKAQAEESAKRIERVKEIKRGLKDWEGWRMDIVDLRMAGGGGTGEIFDV